MIRKFGKVLLIPAKECTVFLFHTSSHCACGRYNVILFICHDTKVWEGIAYSGIGIAVATIPVFICAGQKKEKAIVVSAGCGNLAVPLSAGKLACRQGIALQICF